MFSGQFLGEIRHTVDDKGRINIPARFRDLLMAEGAFIMRGLDKNLWLMPSAVFDRLAAQLDAMNMADPEERMVRRKIYSQVYPVEIDRLGRMMVPQPLRCFAEEGREVVLAGQREYLEIWPAEEWDLQVEQMEHVQLDPKHINLVLRS